MKSLTDFKKRAISVLSVLRYAPEKKLAPSAYEQLTDEEKEVFGEITKRKDGNFEGTPTDDELIKYLILAQTDKINEMHDYIISINSILNFFKKIVIALLVIYAASAIFVGIKIAAISSAFVK